jgi:hypothetical protein
MPDLSQEERERLISRMYRGNTTSTPMWGLVVASILMIGGIVLFLSSNQSAQTTTTDGRNIETRNTAPAGAAR